MQRKKWLEQYYQIRQECFRQELGIRTFDGSEDDFDRSGYLLIALDQERCVGGVRLSVSTPESPQLLPLEIGGFMLQEFFPDIARNRESYSQWTRLALLPEYRTPAILQQMAVMLIWQAKRLGCSYSFNVAGMNRARLYQRLHRVQGYHYEIIRNLKIPSEGNFMGLEHLLSVGYLKPQLSQQLLSRQLPRHAPVAYSNDLADVAAVSLPAPESVPLQRVSGRV
ncbi:MAG: GNAT family N-acyltransferase [Motiliproteus sp.]